MDQVDEYGPPPNPAKITDSRAPVYIAEFGNDSWELDALEPMVLADLIEKNVRNLIREDMWEEAVEKQNKGRRALARIANRWDTLMGVLNDQS